MSATDSWQYFVVEKVCTTHQTMRDETLLHITVAAKNTAIANNNDIRNINNATISFIIIIIITSMAIVHIINNNSEAVLPIAVEHAVESLCIHIVSFNLNHQSLKRAALFAMV